MADRTVEHAGRTRFSPLAILLCISVALIVSAVRAQDRPSASAPGRSVWDGVYTEAQSDRGRAVYDQECVSCHGSNLAGFERAPALVGGDFISDVNDKTLADLLDYMRDTMPADSPGRLSQQQYVDIIAFLLKMNRLPAGQNELGRDSATLKHIQWRRCDLPAPLK